MMTCCRVDDICRSCVLCFFVNDTATTEIYTLSLHDALPIFEPGRVTVDSLHWARTAAGMVPVSHSEFARDASFGYLNSDLDRKSTRLNSSHANISYAVFCLKKKKNHQILLNLNIVHEFLLSD